jgi:hypothetical protein
MKINFFRKMSLLQWHEIIKDKNKKISPLKVEDKTF